jgi:hypothetical protein
MSDTLITFPSASNQSKLSACPTTKIPQAADWIFQDFFYNMMDSNQDHYLSPSVQILELFPQEKHFITSSTFSDECPDLVDNSKSDDEEEEDEGVTLDWLNMAPVLIESNISSCTTESTEEVVSFRNMDYTTSASLKKRRSTSSFSSLKSFMSVFNNSSKKTKLYHPSLQETTALAPQRLSMTATISKKIFKYFKRHL